MVVIAVAGGTGTAGRAVVAEAIHRGLEVRAFSRHLPHPDSPARVPGARYLQADAATGDGLQAALEGADVVVETLDSKSGASLKAMPSTTVNLLRAAQTADVRRAVLLSIVNSDQSTFHYYRIQAERAERYQRSELQTVTVQATQFHELLAGIFSTGARVGLIPAFRGASFQPISTADVARALFEAATGDRTEDHAGVVVGGPDVLSMRQLAVDWKSALHRRGIIVPLPLPGSFGRFLREAVMWCPKPPWTG
ncbi:NAD(P)H-binding protein [Paenarthrobacter sp. Z7-10]|uniref:SDR family oxidoreductase n=1 Tax=Paenarthrobacter sp. Z7-10 TaxID=2787635 RepID=UPI0022A91AA2|nr:NAD(P)H-binding protein [Paenarthrobacter sp. Z7-10]MCZ2404354.1 NAD(P)H-binding protein [Paenarthrobacter sp. Z7-10]